MDLQNYDPRDQADMAKIKAILEELKEWTNWQSIGPELTCSGFPLQCPSVDPLILILEALRAVIS